eukprot:5347103-Amphidinium_carterae.1
MTRAMGQPASTIRITASTRKGIAVGIDSREAGSTNPAMRGTRVVLEDRTDASEETSGVRTSRKPATQCATSLWTRIVR